MKNWDTPKAIFAGSALIAAAILFAAIIAPVPPRWQVSGGEDFVRINTLSGLTQTCVTTPPSLGGTRTGIKCSEPSAP